MFKQMCIRAADFILMNTHFDVVTNIRGSMIQKFCFACFSNGALIFRRIEFRFSSSEKTDPFLS
jgi:hypothetical protein